MKKIIFFIIVLCVPTFIFAQETFKELSDKGNVAMSDKEYGEAIKFFESAFKVGGVDESNLAWTASLAAICAQELGDNAKAIAFNNIAIDNNTTDLIIYETQLELAKATKDNETTERVLSIGREKLDGYYQKYSIKLLYHYYNSKQFEKVFIAADEVLSFNPNHTKSYYFKGVAYLMNKNGEEAEKSFVAALAIDSMDVNSNKQLGLIYYNQASSIHDKAKAKYNGLAKATREDYHFYNKAIERANAPYRKAIPYLERCYSLKPSADVKEALRLIYTRLGQKEKAAKYSK